VAYYTPWYWAPSYFAPDYFASGEGTTPPPPPPVDTPRRAAIAERLRRRNAGVLEMLLDPMRVGNSPRSHADLPDPLDSVADAMVQLGLQVIDPSAGPNDGELAIIPPPRYGLMVRLADLRYKEELLASVHAVASEGDHQDRKEWSKVGEGLAREIKRLTEDLETALNSSYAPVAGRLSPKPQPPHAVNVSAWVDDD
jgi:hypothetical protein